MAKFKIVKMATQPGEDPHYRYYLKKSGYGMWCDVIDFETEKECKEYLDYKLNRQSRETVVYEE